MLFKIKIPLSKCSWQQVPLEWALTVKVSITPFILGHLKTLRPTSKKLVVQGEMENRVAFLIYQGLLLNHVDKDMKQFVKTVGCRWTGHYKLIKIDQN